MILWILEKVQNLERIISGISLHFGSSLCAFFWSVCGSLSTTPIESVCPDLHYSAVPGKWTWEHSSVGYRSLTWNRAMSRRKWNFCRTYRNFISLCSTVLAHALLLPLWFCHSTVIFPLVTRGQLSCSGGQKGGRTWLTQRQATLFLSYSLKSWASLAIQKYA